MAGTDPGAHVVSVSAVPPVTSSPGRPHGRPPAVP
jgi:hypothetical protein